MYVILLIALMFISATLAGLFAPPFEEGKEEAKSPNAYLCCNTGDGANCKVDPSVEPVMYKGKQYGLLKSDVYLRNINYSEHFDPAPDGEIMGQKVFLNVIPQQKKDLGPNDDHLPGCDVPQGDNAIDQYKKKIDWVYGKKVNNDKSGRDYGCHEVHNDMLVYVCRGDNPAGECEREPRAGMVRWDVWIRIGDEYDGKLQTKWKFLSECYKPEADEEDKGQSGILFRPSPGGQPNLQLRTFKFIEAKKPAIWVSPYCKPAIYLYPERKTEINVTVVPQGEMLLTIPPYPKEGWDVVAEPNGNIFQGTNRFDYLYYEAAIPDQLIQRPKDGYVMPYDERALFLTDLVTKLGLNEKETKQFVAYWVPILPKANYYFVGIMPERTLHEISPVFITPKPKNLIRVTLYFQPLDEKISVTPPLILPVQRDGFTAVEWGGIFKQDKDHPFSCFM